MPPTPDYPGNVKLSGTYQKEAPTVYEWRHYDGFNQLIRIDQDGKEITYQYRGDGLRHCTQVRKLTENQGKTNLYCWDESNLVAEQDDGGKIKTYLRGNNLIAREIDGMVHYYIFNEHGDVTQLWSQNGTCKASYEYDAFGIERNPDKEGENSFQYCGEYLDLDTNTYYLRARYYDPTTGRFSSEDTHWNTSNMIYGDTPLMPNKLAKAPDIAAITQNSNLYVYCGNNPVIYVDSEGNIFMLVTAAVGAVVGGAVGAIYSYTKTGSVTWQSVAGGAAKVEQLGLQEEQQRHILLLEVPQLQPVL